jgi:predicted Fe-Mo cluster-binding NifX family protein
MNGNERSSKLIDALAAISIAILIVAALSGCFGRAERQTVVLVEPGDVVEVTSDKKVEVRTVYTAPDGAKKEATDERSIAGTVAMPKSIYKKMRTSYIAMVDFLNGKITEAEFRAKLQQAKSEQGSGDDQKANVPQAEKDGK